MSTTISKRKVPKRSKGEQEQLDLAQARNGEASGNGHARPAKRITSDANDAAAEAAMNAGKRNGPLKAAEEDTGEETIDVPVRVECRLKITLQLHWVKNEFGLKRWRWGATWQRGTKPAQRHDVNWSEPAWVSRWLCLEEAMGFLASELGQGRDVRVLEDITAFAGRIQTNDDGPAVLDATKDADNVYLVHSSLPAADVERVIKSAENNVSPPAATIPGEVAEELVTLALDEIVFSALNPRKHFDQAALQDLATSIKAEGLIQKPLVRPLMNKKLPAPRYELVDGERRIRAARLAGLTHVGVVVREMTDDEAAARRGIANLKRKDLNAVEEAGWLKELLAQRTDDGAPRYTQESLAATLGFTQSWVANRLRLLELPKPWQERLISGAITPSHARAVLVFKDYPELQVVIEKKLGKQVDRYHAHGDNPQTVDDFTDDVIIAVRGATQSLDGQDCVPGTYQVVKWQIEPTEEQRKTLRIVEVPSRWKEEDPELRALNKKAWAALASAAKREAFASHKKGKDKKGKAAAAKKAEERTPAEQKRIDKQRADALHRNRQAWRLGWMQYLCARAITNPMPLTAVQKTLGWRLVVWCATVNVQGGYDRDEQLADLLGCRRHRDDDEAWGMMRSLTTDELLTLSRRLLAKWLCDLSDATTPVPGNTFDDEEVELLAADLSIDLAHAWRNDLPEFMAAEFFEMHDKAQLVKLGKEWGIHVDEGKAKPQMIQQLRAAPRALPKAIEPVKAATAATKPSKKRKAK